MYIYINLNVQVDNKNKLVKITNETYTMHMLM